jgi:hypothetical protein
MKYIYKILYLSIVLTIAPEVHSGDLWTPQVKFDFEGGSYLETLIWVSGFGYAVDALGPNPESRSICALKDQHIGSKILLEVLNNDFEGQQITSEQATKVLVGELHRRYPCK